MSVRLAEGAIRLEGACPVEDAEPLLTLLQAHLLAPVDLDGCGPLHLAVVQVLLAARRGVCGTPNDPFVRGHLLPLLAQLPD